MRERTRLPLQSLKVDYANDSDTFFGSIRDLAEIMQLADVKEEAIVALDAEEEVAVASDVKEKAVVSHWSKEYLKLQQAAVEQLKVLLPEAYPDHDPMA